jgi:molybdenum cofactor cytidylyltransferase
MGRDKALLPWPPVAKGSVADGTLLSAAILALKPLTEAVLVVAGRNAEQLATIAARHGAFIVINPEPERGQFSSMQIGLRAVLDRGLDAAMLTPVDCPPLSESTLERLCASFASAVERGQWAVAPENNGRRGHPLLASRDLMEAFLTAPVTSNARDVKRTCTAMFEYIPVPDVFVSADVNTPEQYAAVSTQAAARLS